MKLLAQDFPEEMPNVEGMPLEEVYEMTTDIPVDAMPEAYSPSPVFGMAFMAIYLVLILLVIITNWKIFTKAGKPGWAAIVPFYNIIVLLQIIGRPGWWILLFFVPIANLVVSVLMALDLAKVFNKSALFGIMLLWFIPVGYLILAFGSAKYTAPGAPAPSKPSEPTPPAPEAPAPPAAPVA